VLPLSREFALGALLFAVATGALSHDPSQAIRHLIAQALTLKILVVSGWTSLAPGIGLARLQGCGADQVLQKPVSREALLTAVQGLLPTGVT
jgi:hypothetical protein